MIEEIGPPDKIVDNPHYRVAPDAGLYNIARVETWIAANQGKVEQAKASRVKRSAASKKVHEAKRAERRRKEVEWVNGLQIHCRKPLPTTLISDARRRFTFSKRGELLEQKALHAHVRHDFTNYDDLLKKVRDAEFADELRPLLRQRVDAVVQAAILEWSQQPVEDQQGRQRQEQPRIYADASVQQGRAGLGVVGDGWQVSVEGVADSIIEGECLAVLLACEEAKKRNIVAPLILNDNQLVVDWTNQRRGRRSETAQRFAPRIRQALQEIGASLEWIPGSKNLADRPSRDAIRAVAFDGTPLDKLRSLPLEKLRREDFAAVKSGRDEFSAMRKAKLVEAVATQDYETICTPLEKEKYQLSALRWMLRGLSVEKAIRKVEVDREIGHEIAERRQVAMLAEWEDDD
jgi:hypothetical protein